MKTFNCYKYVLECCWMHCRQIFLELDLPLKKYQQNVNILLWKYAALGSSTKKKRRFFSKNTIEIREWVWFTTIWVLFRVSQRHLPGWFLGEDWQSFGGWRRDPPTCRRQIWPPTSPTAPRWDWTERRKRMNTDRHRGRWPADASRSPDTWARQATDRWRFSSTDWAWE